MTKELGGGETAQRLLDTARARQEAFEAASTERKAAIKRTREAFGEEILKNSVYRRTMEVMDGPVLDQLLPLFWGVWNPIELVSKGVTKETPIEVVGKVIFGIKTIRTVKEEEPVPYRGPRRVLPLDPMGFMSKFPVEGADFDGRGLDPVTAYLQSIGLTKVEEDVFRRFPPEICHIYGAYERDTSTIDLNQPHRQRFFDEITTIRKHSPSYGGGSCGIIELKTPAAPGRMGDQGKLRIEAGYDLQSEGFLIKFFADSPFNVVETFTSLGALQEKLAELLVECGVSAVE